MVNIEINNFFKKMESHRQNLLVYSKKNEQIFDLEKESTVFEFCQKIICLESVWASIILAF